MSKKIGKITGRDIALAELGQRRTWTINPGSKAHSSKSGKRGYKRSDNRKAIERGMQ